MSIPAGLTLDLIAFHCLIAANYILDRTSHHMVDAGHAVGRRRTFIKNKRGTAFADFQTLFKEVGVAPSLKHLFVDVREIETFIFGKFLHETIVSV